MTEYTDADLRAEAARQLYAHRPGQNATITYAAMLDARIESTHTPDYDGLTWSEALDGTDLDAAADKVHALAVNAADTSEWAVELGADGLAPSTEHEITVNGEAKPIIRMLFAFEPDMPEDMRTSFVEGIGDSINDALGGEAIEETDDSGDSDSDVFALISGIASRLRDATDGGEYHAVGLIYDLAKGRTTVAEARAELADIEFRHV